MAFVNYFFDFNDFERFFCGKMLQNSDFFEETCFKISK